ncbi:N-acetyl sugar amidotransferase [Paremcibacter congregatus]|uniref:LPS biosynthesis protein n=1 Tax=Paremcibacter congregatus TaxID=2043170 RepID=A0A2G4YR85_9PROT|nr:N-acetyl sugar amidotransferase [Paremcibacter congregatus]PHZ84844.1 LPS biosynthesis protein [Paremcibacter congregatus]QDE26183.1 N-acetyl sugar amidotransferase [Paremcibacter congregatus]
MTKQICTRCIYDNTLPNISFNEKGVCNYCHEIDELAAIYPNGEEGSIELKKVISNIKKAGKGKKYDAIIGVSGGCDSSYLLHYLTTEHNLRLLAVHFDNTYNSTIATENINALLSKLNIDLFTIVVDNNEYDDLLLAHLKAGVKEIDNPTDVGLAATMNIAAAKYGIKYKIDGHCFRTEGSAPTGWVYIDGKYVASVHAQFGTGKLKTFPNLWLSKQLKWMLFNQIKSIRPLYYLNYNKEEAKQMLTETYGWQWYGGHHLENRTASFVHSYFFPKRWGIDFRIAGYSAYCRDGRMTRQEALELMKQDPHIEDGLLDYMKTRLKLTDEGLEALMRLPKKDYTDFKTYKRTFEILRPFFYLMAKMDLIPMSFYLKYTIKQDKE